MAAGQDTDPAAIPFHTEREAMAAVQHITYSPVGAWRDGCHRMLEDTCRSAGVLLGKYDEQVLFLLASWEPATCAVVVGLIRRERAAGLEQGSNILGASGVVLPGGGWISGPSR